LRRFFGSDQGSIGVLAALILPMLIFVLALCVDFMILSGRREMMQVSLDSTSHAVAAALSSKNKSQADVKDYALSFLTEQLKGELNDDEIGAVIDTTTVTAIPATSGFSKIYRVAIQADFSLPPSLVRRLVAGRAKEQTAETNALGKKGYQVNSRSSCCRSLRAADY